jgi:hypothetical protein
VRPHHTIALAGLALVGVAASALPAFAHASFPAQSAFGFEPNPTGGTGAVGSTPPYVANTAVGIVARVPFEQDVPFNGSDDTNVDVKIIVPDGWTNPVCGDPKTQVKSAATNDTNQPGVVVAGWACEIIVVDGHSVLHWSGPQVVSPATAADSAQYFFLTVTTPSPIAQTTYNGTDGTEGFIVDQVYASGETVHWIPNAAFPGTPPVGSVTEVAAGLARTVAAFDPSATTTTTSTTTTSMPTTTTTAVVGAAAAAPVAANPSFTG